MPYPGTYTFFAKIKNQSKMGIVYWFPLSLFVSLNKDKELEGGGGGDQNLCSCFACWGGALKILLVLRGGQRKNIITVQFLLSLPLYNK